MAHANKIVKDAVKYVSRQWGHGWPRLGSTLQEALIRAEVLSEIARAPINERVDPRAYMEHVNAMAMAACSWQGQD
jgi:hypothetical protein